eukprot:s2025_g3.t1
MVAAAMASEDVGVERLLIWLEGGEDLFYRSSPLERSLTIGIFGILVASMGFTALSNCSLSGDRCALERARRQSLAVEVARLRSELSVKVHPALASGAFSAGEDLPQRPEPAYAAYAAYAPSFHLRGAGAVSESEDGAEGADLAADP